MQKIDWNVKTKGVLRSELAKRNITYEELVDLLAKIGVNETLGSVKTKVSRGTFRASFLLQCLQAIECEVLRIE